MTARLAFTGDLFLGADAADRPLDALAAQLPPETSVFLNFEGTLHDDPGALQLQRRKISLTSPVRVLDALDRLSLHAICLNNNHIADYGDEVAALTRDRLARLAPTFGAGYAGDADFHRTVLPLQGVALGYAAYCTPDTSPLYATESRIGPRDLTSERAAADLRHLRDRSDWTIAIVHWGEQYFHHASDDQVRWGRMLVDAGFDLVIGSHPHSAQGHEVYRGKHVFYSLGNFCFPDYDQVVAGYHHRVHRLPRCRWGLLPVFRVENGGLALEDVHALDGAGRRVTFADTRARRRQVARLGASLGRPTRNLRRRLEALQMRYEEFAIREGKGAILARKAAELLGLRARASRSAP